MEEIKTIGRCITELKRNQPIFKKLLRGLNGEQLNWRPSPEKWSLLEITCHLRDEEKEDFRARVLWMIEKDSADFISIDPVGWVKKRNYQGQKFKEVRREFLKERKQSIQILKELGDVDWMLRHDNKALGRISAYSMLCNWLAHDYLHIRQINRYLYTMHNEACKVSLDYAGEW